MKLKKKRQVDQDITYTDRDAACIDRNATYEEELAVHGSIVTTNKGVSMMPLLRQNRDLMVIRRRPKARCRRLDAVLFKRANGEYVLHRILKVRDRDYYIVGDNCVNGEYVADDQIIGILTAVIRDGRTIPVTNRFYKIYVHVWCDGYAVRRQILKVRNVLVKSKKYLD